MDLGIENIFLYSVYSFIVFSYMVYLLYIISTVLGNASQSFSLILFLCDVVAVLHPFDPPVVP